MEWNTDQTNLLSQSGALPTIKAALGLYEYSCASNQPSCTQTSRSFGAFQPDIRAPVSTNFPSRKTSIEGCCHFDRRDDRVDVAENPTRLEEHTNKAILIGVARLQSEPGLELDHGDH